MSNLIFLNFKEFYADYISLRWIIKIDHSNFLPYYSSLITPKRFFKRYGQRCVLTGFYSFYEMSVTAS